MLLSDVGLQVAGTRAIARERDRRSEYVTAALLIGGAFAIAAYLLIVIGGVVGVLPHGVTRPIVIYGPALALAAAVNAYWSLLRGVERQDLVYLTYGLSSAALLGLVIVAKELQLSVDAILALYVSTFALRLALTLAVVERKVGRVHWRFEKAATRALAVAAPAAAVAYILQEVYSHVDVVLLGFIVSAADVGRYAAAYRLIDAVTFLTAGALTAAIFPVFSRLSREGWDEIAPLYNRVIRLLTGAFVPVVLLLVAFSRPLVGIVYGGGRGDVARLFAFLAPSSMLIAVNFTTMFMALAIGWTRAAIVAAGTAAFVNVLANLVTIPRFGVEASAWATLGGELVMVFVFWRALTRRGFPSQTARTVLLAIAIAGLPLFLAALFPSHYVPITLVGVALAFVALPAVGLIRVSDLVAIRKLVAPARSAL